MQMGLQQSNFGDTLECVDKLEQPHRIVRDDGIVFVFIVPEL